MGSHEDNAESLELEELVESFRQMQKQLRDGGAPVDYAALYAYIDRDLSEQAMAEVKHRIRTLRAWFDAYWEVRTGVESALEVDSQVALPEEKQVLYEPGFRDIAVLAARGGKISFDGKDF